MGESRKQTGPSFQAAKRNTSDDTTTNASASARDMRPRGSSRIAVRGFSASCDASARRLNPMAALRAATIARTIHAMRHQTDAPDQSPCR